MPPFLAVFALLPTAYGAIAHLWRGGDGRRLSLFLVASWIGFGLGQLVGMLIGWNGTVLGEIHVLEATIGSIVLLVVVSRPSP